MAQPSWMDASKKAIFSLLIISAVMAGTISAFGAENIEIPTDGVKVYAKSDIASPVIGVLSKGTIVPAATNPVGNFKKVMIVVSGQKKIGYINIYDMKGEIKVVTALSAPVTAASPIPPPSAIPSPEQLKSSQKPKSLNPPSQTARVYPRKTVNYGLHHRTALGIVFGINYQTQGAKQYTDGSGANSNAGSLSGTDPMFGLTLALPVSYRISVEPYLLYKQIAVTGTLTPVFNGPTTSSAFILQQSYLSLGALVKIYSSLSSYFWYGGGLQLDHATSGTFQIGNSTPVTAQQGDLPNLIMVYLSTGVDFKLSQKLFFVPDIRAGALVNTTPAIIEVDGNLSLKYAF